jgi:hypothetical protein
MGRVNSRGERLGMDVRNVIIIVCMVFMVSCKTTHTDVTTEDLDYGSPNIELYEPIEIEYE